jgi:transposase-like protein
VRQLSTGTETPSRVVWSELEDWARTQIQSRLQEMLEEEVTELLGRQKSQRRSLIDPEPGYRNGFGKERRLTMGCGTIRVRRPRVRGLNERFESKILPLFVRRTKTVSDLLPQLYLHGLAHGDFDLALRGLLGEDAPLSASSVMRLTEQWRGEFDQWSSRSLSDLEVVYLWADGVYVKAGLEKEKAALLVTVAGLSDGRKVILGLQAGQRESTESWSELLRDLKRRGLSAPKLVIADGHLGIWGALRNVFPEASEQRCWNHRIVNIVDKLPKAQHAEALPLLRSIPYAKTKAKAERLRKKFQEWCRKKGYDSAAKAIEGDWDRLTTFYSFPKEHWVHLRTTNIVESPFAALRLRTDAAKRFRKVENATAAIWKMLLVAENHFRRLNAPHLLKEVVLGVTFEDGKHVKGSKKAIPA